MAKHNPIGASSAKVLEQGGIRLSIKLEGVFWVQLEELADDQGTTLTKFVHSLLKDLPPSKNKTSTLRVYCQTMLREKIKSIRNEDDTSIQGVMLTACPTPVFIISTNRKITAYNQAFKDSILKGITSSSSDKQGNSPHLTFGQPFNRIISFLSKNQKKIIKSQIGIVVGKHTRNFKVRFAFINEGNVMVFVETH